MDVFLRLYYLRYICSTYKTCLSNCSSQRVARPKGEADQQLMRVNADEFNMFSSGLKHVGKLHRPFVECRQNTLPCIT